MVHPVGFPLFELELVSGIWDLIVPTLNLVFDRAINAAAYNPGEMVVNDTITFGREFTDISIRAQPSPEAINFNMLIGGAPVGIGVNLEATAATGLKAVNNGAKWPGVTTLQLPFP